MSAPDSFTVSLADEAPAAADVILPREGMVLDHYRLKRRLGAGGMGEVYLAQDLELGRVAALKLVRPGRLSAAERERLLHEARLTARLSHPHIVAVYEVNASGPLPFIALEYLEGETLGQRLQGHRPPVAQALRMGHAIASALAHAHAHAVLHRDLKPSNVMIPLDGRLRVVDFGLAVEAAGAPVVAPRAGTWQFMAPEQRRGEPLTPAVDIYAFGELLLHLGCQNVPAEPAARISAIRATFPTNAARLLERCFAPEPGVRPTAEELVDALDPTRRAQRTRADENPYPGLLPFDAMSVDYFFGRDEEIDALVEAVRHTPWLSLVGASGVGKSSLARAGVLPRLVREGGWRALIIRPGRDPLAALARAVLSDAGGGDVVTRDVDAIVQSFRTQPERAGVTLQERARSAGERWILLVDQLEELVTHDVPLADRRAFFAILRGASRDVDDPFRVIATVRDDFVGRLPELAGVRIVAPLSIAARQVAVARPPELCGHTFDDPTLPMQMVRDAGEERGALPLLQFACAQLWQQRDLTRRTLTRDAYVAMGGVAGALARHADRVIHELGPAQRATARTLILRLVGPEGTRVERTHAELVDGLGPQADAVAHALVAQRLLMSSVTDGDTPRYEVVHEALILRWEQLVRWREEARAELRLARDVDEAARLWARRGRSSKETWSDGAIRDVRRGLASHEQLLPPLARQFLEAGETREREARVRRRRLTTAGVVALVVITVSAVGAALDFRRREHEAQRQAEELRVAAGDVGRFSLEVPVFDWEPATFRTSTVAPAELPALQIDLRALPLGRSEYDPALPRREVFRVRGRTADDAAWVFDVEATGGPAALIVHGRARTGEWCAPSILRIRALPGFAERGAQRRVRVAVPSCQATRADAVEIAAGEFVYQGPGDPPALDVRGVLPEQYLYLPRYWIDRTEVPNALFRWFSSAAALTGYPPPEYPDQGFMAIASRHDFPVVAIDAHTGEAFCRFMGKRLPTSQEWEKAARGGVTLDARGRINWEPARLYPWGAGGLGGRVNMFGTEDGWDVAAPVGSYSEGASPYGVLDLLGNVEEWTATPTRDVPNGALRVTRGGHWDDQLSAGHLSNILEVDRNPRFFNYALGVRCVADE